MWKEANNQLSATFVFEDFAQAFAFMTEVAFEAEKMNHHPNTHDAGNIVTEKDRRLAQAIERIYGRYRR